MSGQSLPGDGSERKALHAAAPWDLALSGRLVSCAARKAPPGLTDRLQEEWLADLMARQGAFSRIRFALGCCWATRVIAREFGAAAATTGSSASGQRLLVAHGGYDFSRVSRRTVALIAIVCLHIAILYVYLTGVGGILVVNPTHPLTGHFIVEPTNRAPQPTRLPPPSLARTVVESLPTPDLTFKLPADPDAITVPHSPRPDVAPVRLPPSKAVTRVTGGPGAGFPDTDDYYPPAARRLGEAGTTIVSVCVDPRGRLTAAPAIVDSSGIRQIDEGALRLARAGSGHYRPTTENGQSVSACYAFRIRFQLEDQ
jgi:TonB family protein